jgi:hypothetical protein
VIVFECQARPRRYLLRLKGPIFEGGYRTFDRELEEEREMAYICDCDRAEYITPRYHYALTIVLSSPDQRHYRPWLNSNRHILLLYLPLWSRDEVNAAVPAVYPHRWTAKRDSDGEEVRDAAGQVLQVDLHQQRFDIFGVFARWIFSPLDDANSLMLPQLRAQVEGIDLKRLLPFASLVVKGIIPLPTTASNGRGGVG